MSIGLQPSAASIGIASTHQSAPLSSDLMNVLRELESRFPLDEWKVGGIRLWPLLRLRWFFAEWATHYAQPAAAGSAARTYLANIAAGALAAAWASRRDAQGHDRAPGRRDLVFLSDGVSFARLGGQWVERFCDPLIALAARRGLSAALWTPLHQYHQPRYTPSRFVQTGVDHANLLGALRARVSAPFTVLPANGAAIEWLSRLGFGAHALQAARAVSDACRVRAIADQFKRQLMRARPRLAFLVSFYSLEGMAFVLACRECGVPVVDIQHGVEGEWHPAYAAWQRPPEHDRHVLLPDRFWVWSDWERGIIERWSKGTGHAAVVGGNPWMDVWREGSSWAGASEALAQARRLRERAQGRPIVLVTLQFGLSAPEQLDPLVDLLHSAGDRLAFWIRLHPAMLERRSEIRTRLLGAAAIELDECTDLPLPALLPCCDVHLTHSSSTVIEAAQFGVPSVLTTAYGAELFAPLLADGHAQVHRGSAALLASTLTSLAAVGNRQPGAAPPADAAFDQLLAAAPAAAQWRTE